MTPQPLPPDDPLLGPPPTEVPLPRARLERVIAQVRFSTVLGVEQPDYVAPFQEAIRRDYPNLSSSIIHFLVQGPGGLDLVRRRAWRFTDAQTHWRASLAPDFVALETTAYASRVDFLERWGNLLSLVEEHLSPSSVQRAGLRYIDRITGDALEALGELVRPELLVLERLPPFQEARHFVSEALIELPETLPGRAKLRVRWGHLLRGETVDPTAIEALDEPSWVLDLDLFSSEELGFSASRLLERYQAYSERLYALFRWAVTDRFLEMYGGQP